MARFSGVLEEFVGTRPSVGREENAHCAASGREKLIESTGSFQFLARYFRNADHQAGLGASPRDMAEQIQARLIMGYWRRCGHIVTQICALPASGHQA